MLLTTSNDGMVGIVSSPSRSAVSTTVWRNSKNVSA